MVLFADDTNIFCSGDNLQEIIQVVTLELGKLKGWFDRNKLSLTLSKTKIRLFGNYKINAQLHIQVDGVDIERVSESKFLGVIIDEKIIWKSHIKHVQAKLSKSISVLRKAKHGLDHKLLHILYCSVVLPYLNYCSEVWGNNCKCSLHAISVLQKRAIRIIHDAGVMITLIHYSYSQNIKIHRSCRISDSSGNVQSKKQSTARKHTKIVL